jgi:hypothetical protein
VSFDVDVAPSQARDVAVRTRKLDVVVVVSRRLPRERRRRVRQLRFRQRRLRRVARRPQGVDVGVSRDRGPRFARRGAREGVGDVFRDVGTVLDVVARRAASS